MDQSDKAPDVQTHAAVMEPRRSETAVPTDHGAEPVNSTVAHLHLLRDLAQQALELLQEHRSMGMADLLDRIAAENRERYVARGDVSDAVARLHRIVAIDDTDPRNLKYVLAGHTQR